MSSSSVPKLDLTPLNTKLEALDFGDLCDPISELGVVRGRLFVSHPAILQVKLHHSRFHDELPQLADLIIIESIV